MSDAKTLVARSKLLNKKRNRLLYEALVYFDFNYDIISYIFENRFKIILQKSKVVPMGENSILYLNGVMEQIIKLR